MTKSLNWGEVDFNLYNETFTGRAKAIMWCKHCFSEHHTISECSYMRRKHHSPGMPGQRPTISTQRANQQYAYCLTANLAINADTGRAGSSTSALTARALTLRQGVTGIDPHRKRESEQSLLQRGRDDAERRTNCTVYL